MHKYIYTCMCTHSAYILYIQLYIYILYLYLFVDFIITPNSSLCGILCTSVKTSGVRLLFGAGSCCPLSGFGGLWGASSFFFFFSTQQTPGARGSAWQAWTRVLDKSARIFWGNAFSGPPLTHLKIKWWSNGSPIYPWPRVCC